MRVSDGAVTGGSVGLALPQAASWSHQNPIEAKGRPRAAEDAKNCNDSLPCVGIRQGWVACTHRDGSGRLERLALALTGVTAARLALESRQRPPGCLTVYGAGLPVGRGGRDQRARRGMPLRNTAALSARAPAI